MFRLLPVVLMTFFALLPANAQSVPLFVDDIWVSKCAADDTEDMLIVAYFTVADQSSVLTSVSSTSAETITIVDADDACNPSAVAIADASGAFTLNIVPVDDYQPGDPLALSITLENDSEDTEPVTIMIGVPVLEEEPETFAVLFDQAWARPTIFNDMGDMDHDDMDMAPGFNHAVYGTFVNRGEDTYTLVEIITDAAESVEIHETVIEDDVASMRVPESVTEAGGLVLQPNGVVTFRPIGLHIMLIGLQYELLEGDAIPMTLIYEDAAGQQTEVAVAVPVYDALSK